MVIFIFLYQSPQEAWLSRLYLIPQISVPRMYPSTSLPIFPSPTTPSTFLPSSLDSLICPITFSFHPGFHSSFSWCQSPHLPNRWTWRCGRDSPCTNHRFQHILFSSSLKGFSLNDSSHFFPFHKDLICESLCLFIKNPVLTFSDVKPTMKSCRKNREITRDSPISFHQEITPAHTSIREDAYSLEKCSQKGSELRNKWNRWRQSAVTWVFVAHRMVHRAAEFLLPEILLEIQKLKVYTRTMESQCIFYCVFIGILKFKKQCHCVN